MVVEIKKKDKYEDAIKYEGVVIIDLYTTWCGPCKMLAPILEKLSKDYTKKEKPVKFYKIDVDEFGEIADDYNVASVPTVIIFKNGCKIEENFIGVNTEEFYRTKIEEILEMKIDPPTIGDTK